MPRKITPRFYFVGSHPALDFVNTKALERGQFVDSISSFNDLLDWLVEAELLSESLSVRCKQTWGSSELEEEVMNAADELRRHILSLIRAKFSGDKDLLQENIFFINHFLKEQSLSTKLIWIESEEEFAKVSHTVLRKPLDLLIPIANAAVDFLTTHDLHLVKECENPACSLHFYDNSKNSTRRWCSPKTCGNRMKVAAFLARQKQMQED